jgi:hypothetical protein
MRTAYKLLLLCICLTDARKKKSMSKKTFDSSNELDFNALQSSSNERLNVPVTIYRGVHPQPLKTISLRDLLLEMISDDIAKIAATAAIVDSYEKYLSDAPKIYANLLIIIYLWTKACKKSFFAELKTLFTFAAIEIEKKKLQNVLFLKEWHIPKQFKQKI